MLMKKFYLMISLLMLTGLLQAQTVLFSDNFDSYTAGQRLCSQNNTDWTTWSNAPGTSEDAYVSSEQAYSGVNSLKIAGTNDIIYRFSNQTSGVFDIEFRYFVPSSGNGAYFNIQHYYNPGVEWAFECFLYNSGSGYVTINGANTNFNIPADAWFPVKVHVDLDNNSATLTVNGVDVITWPFNYTSDNTSGICQLGSVNFYAGAPGTGTVQGTYYVDDFVFTEVTAANDGHFVFTPNEDINIQTSNATEAYALNLSNPGGTPVNYRIVPTYTFTPNTTSQGEATLQRHNGNIGSGIIYGSTFAAAAVGFPASDLLAQNLVGKCLTRIEVYLENTAYMINPKIQVYDMNGILVDGPGDIVYEQAFSPIDGLNTVYLTTPYPLDGRDLWFGFYFEQTEATAASETRPVIDCDDATMPDPYGNWSKTSVAWNHLNSNAELTYNWAITGYADGTPITPWMNITPTGQGTLAPNGSATANVALSSLPTEVGATLDGKLHLFSTDIENAENVLNVHVAIIGVGVEEQEQITISIYPNPATDVLNIASENINRVQVYNMAGQLVSDGIYSENEITISTTNWAPGNYFVKVVTQGATRTEKVIIR